MAHPPFPCFAWRSEGSVDGKKLLQAFLEQRPNPHWVLVGEGCVQSELQLWTAWNCASRRWIRSTALARSMDAEFLRYLCGTHHVSEAFKRAGVREGDRTGVLIFLPDATADEEQSDCHVTKYDHNTIESQAKFLLSHLSLEETPIEYSLNKTGAIRLGMKFEYEDEELTESSLIGHILSSEFTS